MQLFKGKKNKRRVFIFLMLISFLVINWFYQTIIQQKLALYLKPIYILPDSLIISLMVSLCLAFLLARTLYRIIYRTKSLKNIKLSSLVYLIALIGFLFFNSSSRQGTTLNPLAFVGELLNGSGVDPFFNLACFVPLGSYLKRFNLKKIVAKAFVPLFSVELVQYIVGLGSFNVSDLFLNYMGLFVGYQLMNARFVKRMMTK
ncbi:MAG: VanZ family protein [Carnobacterium sp.]|uniref:VanZ family protein n=1 Tax=Carnobacterium sp. TaxID=48221 RepID=UPI002FCC1E0F